MLKQIKNVFRIAVIAIAVLLAVTFTLKNPQLIEGHYFFGWSFEVHLIILLAVNTLVVFIAGYAIGWMRARKPDTGFFFNKKS